jgi:hypothetical protein
MGFTPEEKFASTRVGFLGGSDRERRGARVRAKKFVRERAWRSRALTVRGNYFV